MRIQKLASFCAVLVTMACQSHSALQQGTPLSMEVLLTALRIVPAKEYLLLETKAVPQDDDSPRQLVLFDNKLTFLDQIRLYGTVQNTEIKKITVNRSLSGYISEEKIGFLHIDYVGIPHHSKGGGNAGTFLVDSLNYLSDKGFVEIYLRKPKVQFVTAPSDFQWHKGRFIESDKIVVPLKDIELYPAEAEQKYFTITTWDEASSTNATTSYYLNEKSVLENLFQQVRRSRS